VRVPILLVVAVLTGCSRAPAPAPAAAPTTGGEAPRATPPRTRRDTVVVRDLEMERRIARLELRLMEREAQIEELQTRLADSRDEIVRTMAKLRDDKSRAEAASGMAEADVALQALRAAGGGQTTEIAQATRLTQRSSDEFRKENYGGALYLANQAKALATTTRGRLAGGRATLRSGETLFVVPLRLKISARGNVREGPGTTFPVVFSVEAGVELTGYSYADDWIRVTDDAGRSGWIFRALIARP